MADVLRARYARCYGVQASTVRGAEGRAAVSKPRTHYPMPMTMGRSICHVGKPRVYHVGGPAVTHKAIVHASTVDLVGSIEETTCMLCRRIYWQTKDGNPPPGCLCAEDWEHDDCPVHCVGDPGEDTTLKVRR